jgi:hypothetical protein
MVTHSPAARSRGRVNDPKGCAGKTTFAKMMVAEEDATLLTFTTYKDALHVLCKRDRPHTAIIINLVKSVNEVGAAGRKGSGLDPEIWALLETIKDGVWTDGKYEGKMWVQKPPHLIVFANQAPDHATMLNGRIMLVTLTEADYPPAAEMKGVKGLNWDYDPAAAAALGAVDQKELEALMADVAEQEAMSVAEHAVAQHQMVAQHPAAGAAAFVEDPMMEQASIGQEDADRAFMARMEEAQHEAEAEDDSCFDCGGPDTVTQVDKDGQWEWLCHDCAIAFEEATTQEMDENREPHRFIEEFADEDGSDPWGEAQKD